MSRIGMSSTCAWPKPINNTKVDNPVAKCAVDMDRAFVREKK